MYVHRLALKGIICLLATALLINDTQAQDRPNLSSTQSYNAAQFLSEPAAGKSMPLDTLRNYPLEETVFAYWANGEDQLDGWVHGTNAFEDMAKATRITIPDYALGTTVDEVLVFFLYKHSTVTNQTYWIDIRDVAINGEPGNLLGSQAFSMADIDQDDDFSTNSPRTSHVFANPIPVPEEFFVVVRFGSYTSADYQNLAIAASSNRGGYVPQDWDQYSDGTWHVGSDTWFQGEAAANGWYMWIDALVTRPGIIIVDPNEPNDTASNATSIQDGYVSSGAAISPVGDVDYYSFQGNAGQNIDIYATADAFSNLDGIITLYNSSGDFIADNDDFNGNLTESRITIALPATDTYFIRYAYFENDSGADFPNKRSGNDEAQPADLVSAVREYRSSIRLAAKRDAIQKQEISQLDDTGAYTLQFSIIQGNDTTEPLIQHTVSSLIVPAGQDLTLTTNASDAGSGIESVFITWVEGGADIDDLDQIGVVDMQPVSGNTFEGVVSGVYLNEKGFQYILVAFDNAGNAATSIPYDLSVRFEDGFTRPLNIVGTTANSYRLISMPVDLDNNSVRAVLEDDLGTYDPEIWRFWELRPNQTYSEFPSVGTMARGNAFWFVTSQSGQMLTSGPAETGLLDQVFVAQLNPGWTFVGTPFNYPITPAQITLDGGGVPDIRVFTGSWATLNGPMLPFQGYAVASVNGGQLLIDPLIDSASKRGNSFLASKSDAGEYDWSMSIEASSGEFVDHDNVLAVSGSASPGWDAFDRPEPPVIGDYISLYFPHRDWDVPFSQFNTDVRPVFEENQAWTFEVATNLEEAVTLAFKGVELVPAEFDVYLVDRQLHHTQNIRELNSYIIRGREQDIQDRFMLVVGRNGSVIEKLNEIAAIPEFVSLQTYPNPFQSYMTLEYGLPEAAGVTIDVYDLLGKRVATLVDDESKAAGTYAVQWDGSDAAGKPLANGVYVFTVQTTGGSRKAQKVVLIR